MDTNVAVKMLSALGQETRLAAFRQIEAAGEDGVASGDLARDIGIPHNTMSAHLAILVNAGLASSERQSRSIIYRAVPGAADELAKFLSRH